METRNKRVASNGEDRFMRGGIPCPHCRAATRVRSSRQISSTAREQFLFCSNVECGATYHAAITLLNVISPSAMHDPSVPLGITTPSMRRGSLRPGPANDDSKRGSEVPPRANDNDELGEALG